MAIPLERDWGEFTASVSTTDTMYSDDGHPYIVYRIEVETVARAKWFVWKRYNDFKIFFSSLEKTYRSSFPLPKDRGRSPDDPSLIADRKQGFDSLIQSVLKLPNIMKDKEVKKFLSSKLFIGDAANKGKLEKLKSAFSSSKGPLNDKEVRARINAFVERDEEDTVKEEKRMKKETDLTFARQRSELEKQITTNWSGYSGKVKSKHAHWRFEEGKLTMTDSKTLKKGITYWFDEKKGQIKSADSLSECVYGYGEWDGSVLVWRGPSSAMVYQYIYWSPENRWYFDRYLHGPSQWIKQGKRLTPEGGDTTYSAVTEVDGKVPDVFVLIAASLRFVKSQI